MLPVWLILLVAGVLIVGTVLPGLRLWWPTRTEQVSKTDLGLALMTGALIAFAVLTVQILVDIRGRQEDRHRELAAERQSLQISVGQRNLSGIYLGGAHLKNFYLGGKRLNGADLGEARLQGAVLTRAWLVGANLNKAWLSGANLSGARLADATLDDAHLEGANLDGANLDGASLANARLDGAVLTDARMSADLRGADLTNAILDDAKLAGANLIGANLRGAWLADADLRGAVLYGADFRETKLHRFRPKATLKYAALNGARYDATTHWPKSKYAPPPCVRGSCIVCCHAVARPVVKELRQKLAAAAPHGWDVVAVDPKGMTLRSPKGDAEFNGDSLARGSAPLDCELAYGGSAMVHYRRDLWVYEKLDGLRMAGRAAAAVRYGFVDDHGRPWMAIDVYFAEHHHCYRLRGIASPEVFLLFHKDFAKLFGVLGLTRTPKARHRMLWLTPALPKAHHAAAASNGSAKARVRVSASASG